MLIFARASKNLPKIILTAALFSSFIAISSLNPTSSRAQECQPEPWHVGVEFPNCGTSGCPENSLEFARSSNECSPYARFCYQTPVCTKNGYTLLKIHKTGQYNPMLDPEYTTFTENREDFDRWYGNGPYFFDTTEPGSYEEGRWSGWFWKVGWKYGACTFASFTPGVIVGPNEDYVPNIPNDYPKEQCEPGDRIISRTIYRGRESRNEVACAESQFCKPQLNSGYYGNGVITNEPAFKVWSVQPFGPELQRVDNTVSSATITVVGGDIGFDNPLVLTTNKEGIASLEKPLSCTGCHYFVTVTKDGYYPYYKIIDRGAPSEPTSPPEPTSEPVPTAPPQPQPTSPPTNCPRFSEGDANCDNAITMVDFVSWRNSYLAQNTEADFNGKNGTDMADFVIWRNTYLAEKN